MPDDCIRVLECKVRKEEAEVKQAQSTGQRMDQARDRFRRAVEAGEKAQAQEAMLQAQVNFEPAWQEVVQAQLDLHKLMQEAPLPVMPTPQVNVSLVKSSVALTELIENMWNLEGQTTTRPSDSCNPRVEGNSPHFISDHVQEGGAASEAEAGVEQDPEL